MDDQRFQELREIAKRGKYRPLFEYLDNGHDGDEWQADFSEIERVLGFGLPPSARRYRAWWANTESHSQARAWLAAGWRVDAVDMDAEIVTLRRSDSAPRKRKLSPNKWSVSHSILLCPDATFGREEIYDDRI